MEKKIVEFNGEIYERSEKGKYYFKHTTKNEERKKAIQLHRAVWTYYNGEIPKGYHIHHVDGDIDNNDISNLVCLSSKEHLSLHGKKNLRNEEYKEKIKKVLDSGREKAKEWHKSEEGIKWHREHAKKCNFGNNFRETRVCEYCGKKFIAKTNLAKCCGKQCSTKNTEFKKERICMVCGKIFHSPTYSAKTCSQKCSVIQAIRTKSLQHES